MLWDEVFSTKTKMRHCTLLVSQIYCSYTGEAYIWKKMLPQVFRNGWSPTET